MFVRLAREFGLSILPARLAHDLAHPLRRPQANASSGEPADPIGRDNRPLFGDNRSMAASEDAPDPRHSLAEDIHALLMGASFAAFGVVMLKAAGLVTGGIAGVSLILSYLFKLPVGPLFFALNLPFFIVAQRTMGWPFTLKSLATTALLSVFTLLMPQWIHLTGVNAIFAAIFGGSLIGMGVLALARHKSSVGGIGVLALWLYEKKGVNAGKVQVAFDVCIVASSFFVVDLTHLALSVVSAAALSLVMIAYHRPGRYAGY
jgi:uncharacterized membrane-anchored protein YitT (DUF2179 family)